MNTIRDFRNASAHSNCLMNKMTEKVEPSKQPDSRISNFIKNLHCTSDSSRAKNLHMRFTYNIVTLLYVYDSLVPHIAKSNRYKELQEFINGRVIRHKDYFYSNSKICGTYNFLKKIIDNLNN